MKKLEKIIKCKDVLLETKTKIIHIIAFPIIIYRYESWTFKKADRKKNVLFEIWCWMKTLKIPWIAIKINSWILDRN